MPSQPPDAPAPADRPDEKSLTAGTPSILAVSRLSNRPFLSPSAEALYRRIAKTAALGPDSEFVLAPSGRGLTTRFLAQVSGASGVGADPNPTMADDAMARGRGAGRGAVHFDVANLADLPYQDGIFDFAMGELGLGASRDPAAAVRELVRVVKPMGTVALLQLVWTRQMEADRRESLVRMLGVRPMLLVEWKQMLRDAGAVELTVEDLTDAVAAPTQPLLGVAGLMDYWSLRDRMAVLYRAWRRWGWRGLRETIAHGNEVRHLIVRERVLGLALIRGTRWPKAPDAPNEATTNREE
ncbi:MAG TPA: methyltransferase domain-containing protein [Longimicrobiales bacterium]